MLFLMYFKKLQHLLFCIFLQSYEILCFKFVVYGLDWCTLFDGVLNFLFIVLVRPARDNR